MDAELQDRTEIEALNDLDYEIRLHYRHVRLYRRTRAFLMFIAALGSASAFANAFAVDPRLTAFGGLVVAVCGFADLVWDYGKKAAEHEVMRKEYTDLKARASKLTLEQLDAGMAKIAKNDPGHFESLRWPAQNDVLRSRGYYDQVRQLTAMERLFNFAA